MTNLNIGFGVEGNKASYMQDVNKAFCDSLPNVTNIDNIIEGRLIDKRDGKVYWVAKLTDNMCWMTQNLDFNISEGVTLTSNLSDVDNWTPGDSQGTSTTVDSSFWPNTAKIIRSYDPGFNVFLNGKTQTQTDAALFYDLQYGINNLGWTETRDGWFIGVTSYLGTDEKTLCAKEAGSRVGDLDSPNPACRIYYYDYFEDVDYSPIHYAQGNYYSWVAAKAGSSSTNPDTSICAKGWKLPLSNTNNLGSFAKLGLTKDNAYLSPYYFIYGGHIYNSRIASLSDEGWYWSSTAYNTNSAYNLFFTNASLNGSNTSYGDSFYGLTVRCVAR